MSLRKQPKKTSSQLALYMALLTISWLSMLKIGETFSRPLQQAATTSAPDRNIHYPTWQVHVNMEKAPDLDVASCVSWMLKQ